MATLREVKKRINAVASTLLVMVFVIGICETSVRAQTEFGYGFKTGITMAKFWGDDVADAKFRNGFSGGGFFFADVSEQVRIQSEILYVTKGSNLEVGLDSHYSYLAFPLLFKFLIPTGGSVTPNLFIGGEIAYNLSAKLVNGVTFDIKEAITDFDLGIVIGGELGFDTSTGNFTIELRYTRGLRGLDDSGGGLDFKHNVISMMIGFLN